MHFRLALLCPIGNLLHQLGTSKKVSEITRQRWFQTKIRNDMRRYVPIFLHFINDCNEMKWSNTYLFIIFGAGFCTKISRLFQNFPYSSSSSPSSSSSSYSSSPSSSPSSSACNSSLSKFSRRSSSCSTASSSSSGVSGSLPFLPGLSPYHFGSLAAENV